MGTILMYASLFFYWLPTESEIVVKTRCVVSLKSILILRMYISYIPNLPKVEFWLFTIGYSFAIGAVLAKMWRVFQIFNNPQPNTKVCTPYTWLPSYE